MLLSEAFRKAEIEHYRQSKHCIKQAQLMDSVLSILPEKITLKDLTSIRIHQLVNDLKATGNAPGTINRKLAVISKTLRLSVFWEGGVNVNELPLIKRLKERTVKTRVISPAEEQELLGELHKHSRKVALFVTTLIDTGCRCGELLNPKTIVDIDKGYLRIWENKGDKPRSVPLMPRVKQIYTDNPNPFSELTYKHIQHIFQKVRKAMSLENDKEFTLHCCRHTCASRLWETTGDIYLVKEWLGHSSVMVTERYTHLQSDKLEAARDLLISTSTDATISTIPNSNLKERA